MYIQYDPTKHKDLPLFEEQTESVDGGVAFVKVPSKASHAIAALTPWYYFVEDDSGSDIVIHMKGTAFSDRPWAGVNKSKLPKACFLDVRGDKKEDWHLPYREGAGKIGPNGMYERAGPVSRGALRAIAGALGGARTGKAYKIPSAAMARFRTLYKAAFGREYGKE